MTLLNFQMIHDAPKFKRNTFRLSGILAGMYPPKVEDQQICGLIRELTVDGRPPSGRAVRAALASRFGSRGGVARIYRLLGTEHPREVGTPLQAVRIGLLEVEIRNLREQLQLARQREDAHQIHWTRVVGQLLDHVRTLETSVSRAAATGAIGGALVAELKAAEIKAGQLAVLIRAFGPATGRQTTSD